MWRDVVEAGGAVDRMLRDSDCAHDGDRRVAKTWSAYIAEK